MHPNLSFEQAPPISVPLRFFLTAPWFAVAAGLSLAWAGGTPLSSRWSGGVLALTHLIVVGFMLQAMMGALFQFVPVAAGGNVWRPRVVAGVVHPLLVLAGGVLVFGLFNIKAVLLRAGAAMFLIGIALAVTAIGLALVRSPARGATIRALRLAVGGLAVTVLLGTTLVEGLSGVHALRLIDLTNLHASWGLAGWGLMLLAGASYFVVPMFQLTPSYPARFSALLPYSLAAGLVPLSLLTGLARTEWNLWIWLYLLAVATAFAGVTLALQSRRRRRVSDPTFILFRTAMLSLIVAAACAAYFLLRQAGFDGAAAWWFGVLVLVGVFVSAINGMLYKIVPFLCWLHLQRVVGLGTVAPNMRDMIPERAMRRQSILHLSSLALLLLAALWSPVASVAGGAFAASNAWLGWNLASAAFRYRRFRARALAAAADPAVQAAGG